MRESKRERARINREHENEKSEKGRNSERVKTGREKEKRYMQQRSW